MRNTLKSGKLRSLIYKAGNGYVGICYETGYVLEGETIEEVKLHIENSLSATLQTIKNGHLSEDAINQKPALVDRIKFYTIPLFFALKRLEISFFTKPISPGLLSNA